MGLAIGVPVACGGDGPRSPEALRGATRRPPLRVGEVSLPDVSPGGEGRDMPMRADPDGLLVVFFGFTHCPDVCPTTLSDIGRAQERLDRSERRRVQVAFVTIDPARDDARVMNAFLRHFTSGGHALRTDDPAQLERAKDAFRVTARRIAYPGGGPDEYGFEHTSTAYVVDDSGTVVVEWPFGTRPGDMAADLRLLLSRARNR
jgi:protein SCO1/2